MGRPTETSRIIELERELDELKTAYELIRTDYGPLLAQYNAALALLTERVSPAPRSKTTLYDFHEVPE